MLRAVTVADPAAALPAPRSVTHLIFVDELPPDVGARVAVGRRVIFINASWPPSERRRALRTEIRQARSAA
jgi:hypothetical protein